MIIFDHPACLLRAQMARQLDSVFLDRIHVLLIAIMLRVSDIPTDMPNLVSMPEELDLDAEKSNRAAHLKGAAKEVPALKQF